MKGEALEVLGRSWGEKEFEVTVSIRNNRLKKARLAAGLTQGELAKLASVNIGAVNALECLRRPPALKNGQPPRVVLAICDALDERPEDLFPGILAEVTTNHATMEMGAEEVSAVLGMGSFTALSGSSPDDIIEARQQMSLIERGLERLPPRVGGAIRAHYGLGGDAATFDEIGDDLGVSRERARQVVEGGLRDLRKMCPEDGGPRPLSAVPLSVSRERERREANTVEGWWVCFYGWGRTKLKHRQDAIDLAVRLIGANPGMSRESIDERMFTSSFRGVAVKQNPAHMKRESAKRLVERVERHRKEWEKKRKAEERAARKQERTRQAERTKAVADKAAVFRALQAKNEYTLHCGPQMRPVGRFASIEEARRFSEEILEGPIDRVVHGPHDLVYALTYLVFPVELEAPTRRVRWSLRSVLHGEIVSNGSWLEVCRAATDQEPHRPFGLCADLLDRTHPLLIATERTTKEEP